MPTLRPITNAIADVRTSLALSDTPAVRKLLYAQLGTIRFEVVGPITGLEAQRAYTFAKHAVIDGKPRLQFTGEELEQLTLTLRFITGISDPVTGYADLCAAAAARQAMPLVFASGQVLGRYVITELGDTIDRTDETGVVLVRSLRVTLSEWAVDDMSDAAARKSAATTAAAAAVAGAPTVVSTGAPDPALVDLATPPDDDDPGAQESLLRAILRRVSAAVVLPTP